MVNLTRIYTRTGDDGTTALGDMSRTAKTGVRLSAFADVVEANRSLGVVLALGAPAPDVADLLLQVQNDLFDLGADLCTRVVPDPAYLPLRVNMAGVIPVIFAASIMAFPPTVGELVPGAKGLSNFFSPNSWAYIAGETVFIILFCYFYTAVTFNPVDQADNLKKYGGFIPGVRPGRPTAEFLDRILARLTFPGALYLAAVAALPTILINQTSANFFFGGTSILIMVGVGLETVKQIDAQLQQRHYEGLLR